MADKDVQVSLSGSTVSVDKQIVEVKKNVDQVKWNISTPGLETLTIQRKDNNEVLASCSANGNDSCSAKSKTFSEEGTIAYNVIVTANGETNVLDPDIIIKP